MRLWLERFGFGRDSTLGRLSIAEGDEEPEEVCYTIEDERRTKKVPGETCIPAGVYKIELRAEGGMHPKYVDRYPELHRGMLWLQNVPNFTYVYIHKGNTDDHTDGCILPNEVPVCLPDGEFVGQRSEPAYLTVYKRAVEAMDAGEEVVISITEKGP